MEKLRRWSRRREQPAAGAPGSLPAGGSGASALRPESRAVQVAWGSMWEPFDLAGMTVEDAQRLLQRPYNIAPQAYVTVNGTRATPNQRLVAGDVLEFVRLAGEKGGVG